MNARTKVSLLNISLKEFDKGDAASVFVSFFKLITYQSPLKPPWKLPGKPSQIILKIILKNYLENNGWLEAASSFEAIMNLKNTSTESEITKQILLPTSRSINESAAILLSKGDQVLDWLTGDFFTLASSGFDISSNLSLLQVKMLLSL